MLVDLDKAIIANNRARHMFDVMEIPDIVGYRTSDVAINWPLVGMVMDTGIAESKEFKMHGLLLSMRVLPVVPKPRGGCAVVILKDITELRKKDEELSIKSVVIKEIHHRVKNNLQTIASLLRLQERRTQNSETKTVLRDCIGRVNSIAIVHEYLSQQDTGLINVGKVAKGIYQAIISSMLAYDFVLETHFSAAEVQLPSDKATNIALILNELLQNAIEHAFVGRNHGSLQVDFTEEVDKYTLSIIDDGIGLPKDFQITGRKSLGLKIIKTMAESDLHGSFILRNNAQGGTQALVTIPKAGEL
ncbi:MAG: sensor histidine kinase [Phascolarctobacterium sp.]